MRQQVLRTRVTAPARGYHIYYVNSERRTIATSISSTFRLHGPQTKPVWGAKLWLRDSEYSFLCYVVPDVSCDTLVLA